jgi:serine-type D-Ala-D-Ala carboxypeptidase
MIKIGLFDLLFLSILNLTYTYLVKLHHLIITLCSLTTFFQSTFGQKRSNLDRTVSISRRIDSILNGAVTAQQIPGAVVLVTKKGELLIHKSYGYSQLLNRDGSSKLSSPPALTTQHLFDVASLTKTFATTAILLLVDRELLQLDDAVAKHLPSFNTPDKKAITIRQLLSHSSGLQAWYPMYYRASNKYEVYDLIASLPLEYPTGTQRKYSDLGFTILSQLIEVVSKSALADFMKKEIFTPLSMQNTCYNPLQSLPGRAVAATSIGNPYEYRMVRDSTLGFRKSEINPDAWNGWRNYNLIGEVNDGNTWYAGHGISGAAGIFSTAEDLHKLAKFWLNKGQSVNLHVRNKKLVQEFLTLDEFKNGLGWIMDNTNSFMKNAPMGTFGHTGFTGTSMMIVPSKETIVILLINRQQTKLQENKEYYNVNPIRRIIFEMVTQ